jgi:hypothetical protein
MKQGLQTGEHTYPLTKIDAPSTFGCNLDMSIAWFPTIWTEPR